MEELDLIFERYQSEDDYSPQKWYIENNMHDIELILNGMWNKIKHDPDQQAQIIERMIRLNYPNELIDYTFSIGLNPFLLLYNVDKDISGEKHHFYYAFLTWRPYWHGTVFVMISLARKYHQDPLIFFDYEWAEILIHTVNHDIKEDLVKWGYIKYKYYFTKNLKGNTPMFCLLNTHDLTRSLMVFQKIEASGCLEFIFSEQEQMMLFQKLNRTLDFSSINLLSFLLRPHIKTNLDFTTLLKSSSNYVLQSIYQLKVLEKKIQELETMIEYSPDNEDPNSIFKKSKEHFDSMIDTMITDGMIMDRMITDK